MKLVVFALVVLQLASSVLSAAAFTRAGQVRVESCYRVNELSLTLAGLVENGYKRLPTLAYYKLHPDELRSAQREQLRSIRVLSETIDCK